MIDHVFLFLLSSFLPVLLDNFPPGPNERSIYSVLPKNSEIRG